MNSLKIDSSMVKDIISPLIRSLSTKAMKSGLIPTGIESIDSKLLHGGLRRGQAYFIRGVNWIGKMSFALNIVANQISKEKEPTKILFIPGAHDISSILLRLICITAKVPSIGIHGAYSAEHIHQIEQATDVVSSSEIGFISSASPEDLRLQCFQLQPDIVVVDRPWPETEQIPAALFSVIAKESDAVVLVLAALDAKVGLKMKTHKRPEEIIKAIKATDNNIDGFVQFVIHRDSFYEHLKEDQEFYDFFVLYYDGINSTDMAHCLRSRESEDILSLPDDQKGVIE